MAADIVKLVFPGFKFGMDDPEEAEALVKMGVGGFCVYGGAAREIAGLTRRLQEAAEEPLLFCADYEEGLASQVPDGTKLPSQMGLGASGSEHMAYRKGAVTAAEARAVGVRWVFAPVVDLANVPANPIVNIRAFSDQVEPTIRLARAYMRGLRSEKVLSCLKHFPGHGDTRSDSHLKLPTVRADRETMERREMAPFRGLLDDADSVMIAHLKVPALGDKRLPASLSSVIIGGLLRRGLKYDGLVVTDALSMRAIAGRYPEEKAALLALKAGSDVILVPENPRRLVLSLAELELDSGLAAAVQAGLKRLRKAKAASGLFEDRGLAPEKDLERIAGGEHLRAAREMAEACLAWAGPEPRQSLSRKVYYCEADSADPRDWKGAAFQEELRSLGVEFVPEPEGAEDALVACFLRPRAYAGFIKYPGPELARLKGLKKRGRRLIVAAFGSPWVMKQFRGLDAGLCAFSSAPEAQRAAARALAGRLAVSGRMPVAL